ncbi:MAG: ROK family protein [Bacteroidota bacterium]|nr:ROK family protein [Bacteroidota bacterium]
MDNRIVMTLDAGGTKFNFSAIRNQEEIIKAVILPAQAADLVTVLKTIIEGFEKVKSVLDEDPVAISFSFPGPADYENGIIGDLENLPHFRKGVALKAMLEDTFGIPVFINNDGDLFAYGEAIAGLLPEINQMLKEKGNPRQYRNLLGVTFGTGFGGGIISDGKLFTGDNSSAGEINRSRNKLYPVTSVEDSVSIRGLKRVFAREAGIGINDSPEPKEMFNIASGRLSGNKNAALAAFDELSVVAGDCIAGAITLIDGLVVIGGGLSGAHPVFLQKLVNEMNRSFHTLKNKELDRLELKAFSLENPEELAAFLSNSSREIEVPFTNKKVMYDPVKRIGVGISRLGTSRAAAIGAWAFALDQLDK